MPDKAKRTTIDELAGWFSINKQKKSTDNEVEELPAQQKPAFNKPEVVFKYENSPDKAAYIDRLANEGILEYMDVTAEVMSMQNDISQKATNYLRILNEGITSSDYKISKDCKVCEFNTPGNDKNGFKECWGNIAYTNPNIFDLYYGGSIKYDKTSNYLDWLISKGKNNLFDIEPEFLLNNKGECMSSN